jgi:hypothetical protein
VFHLPSQIKTAHPRALHASEMILCALDEWAQNISPEMGFVLLLCSAVLLLFVTSIGFYVEVAVAVRCVVKEIGECHHDQQRLR